MQWTEFYFQLNKLDRQGSNVNINEKKNLFDFYIYIMAMIFQIFTGCTILSTLLVQEVCR